MAVTETLTVLINAKDTLSGALRGITGTLGKFGSFALGMTKKVAFAFAGVAAGFGAMGAAAIKSAGDFEQQRVAFETILGSAEKAKAMLSDLTEFARTTPFELPDVTRAGKQLLAVGAATEDNLTDVLRTLGDVAAGVSVPLDRLILNFGQVATQGKLTGRELKDFAVAGIPIIDELAKVMGVTKEEVADLTSEGKIGFEDVKQAFANMSGEGGKFFNLMDKQSKTAMGIISNLKDTIGILGREIVGISTTGDIVKGGLFDKFKGAAQSLLAFLETNKGRIIEFFQTAFGFVTTTIVPMVMNAFNALRGFLSSNGDEIKEILSNAWGTAKTVFTTVWNLIMGFVGWVKENLPTFKNIFVSVWEAVSGAVKSFMDKVNFEQTKETFTNFYKTIERNMPYIKGAFEDVGGVVAKVWNAFVTLFSIVDKLYIFDAIVIAFRVIVAVVKIAATLIENFFSSLKGSITSIGEFIKKILAGDISGAFEGLKKAGEERAAMGKEMLSEIGGDIGSIFGKETKESAGIMTGQKATGTAPIGYGGQPVQVIQNIQGNVFTERQLASYAGQSMAETTKLTS